MGARSTSGQPLMSDFPIQFDDSALIARIDLAIEPVSKARPRFGGGGRVYTPAKTIAYERTLAHHMRAAMNGRDPVSSRVGLACAFYRKTAQRVDCDNMIKAVSDAANRVIWIDDAQCVEIYARLHRNSSSPRIVAVFYEVFEEHGKPCAQCGAIFRRPPSQDSDCCSVKCAVMNKRVDVKCRHCGKVFSQPQSLAARSKGYCSRECGMTALGNRKRAVGSDKWICADCGGRVTRKEYVVCRGCSMKRRGDPTSNYWKLRHAPKVDG